MKKQVLTLVMSGLMTLAPMTAFADATCTNDTAKLDLSKVYELANDNESSPAETFTFNISNYGVTDSEYTKDTMPSFASSAYTVTFDKGAATKDGTTKKPDIALPTFDRVGNYTYKITEQQGSTAGVKYSSKTILATVQVVNCPDGKGLDRSVVLQEEGATTKPTGFTNKYSAGKLNVTKSVTGLLGDHSKSFKATVTFKAMEGTTVNSEISMTDIDGNQSTLTFAKNSSTLTKEITIKDGKTVTFDNIPYGVIYTVAEDDYAGYSTTYKVSGKTDSLTSCEEVVDAATEEVTVINNKGGEIQTGILWTMAPYAGILVLTAGIAVLLIMRRRKMNEQ